MQVRYTFSLNQDNYFTKIYHRVWNPKTKATRILMNVVIQRKSISNECRYLSICLRLRTFPFELNSFHKSHIFLSSSSLYRYCIICKYTQNFLALSKTFVLHKNQFCICHAAQVTQKWAPSWQKTWNLFYNFIEIFCTIPKLY